MGFKEFFRNRSLKVKDNKRTKAAELTLRESIYPICLVTVLVFLWGFSYGLLDTLNVSSLSSLPFLQTLFSFDQSWFILLATVLQLESHLTNRPMK